MAGRKLDTDTGSLILAAVTFRVLNGSRIEMTDTRGEVLLEVESDNSFKS